MNTSNVMSKNRPYIIWDWNGTLLDDTAAALDTLNLMLSRRGNPPIDMSFYRDHFSFPVKPFYRSIGVCLENEDWDQLAKEYHDIYAQMPKRLNPLAIETLERAAAEASGQSILSALREDLLNEITAELGVARFMDAIAGVDNLDGASKIERGKELMSRLGGKDRSFVLIGDSLHDKEVADELGIASVLCAQGSHAFWRLSRVAPTGKDLREALDIALNFLI